MREASAGGGCVILAERHHALSEGVRGLLETAFRRVFVVADEASLIAGAGSLDPDLIVAELAMASGDLPGFVGRLRGAAPAARLLLLTDRDHPTLARIVAATGADGYLAKRAIATELLAAVDTVLAGQRYLSRAAARV